MTDRPRNWAGNYEYRAARWHTPETVEQIQSIVAGCRKVRAVGTRHSFNSIADTEGDLISLARLDRVLAIDPERRTVTIEGGVRYGELGAALARAGFALHNLASLPHISVAGACATATHGSGDRNGNLATAVAAVELVTGTGEVVTLSRERDGERFLGAVVGLGALGIVTKLTLAIEPGFAVAQTVYEGLPAAALDEHFDDIMSSAYSVSLFTMWDEAAAGQVWVKRREGEAAGTDLVRLGATPARAARHPLPEVSAASCTPQLGVPGPAHERLPHFRLDHTPSYGEELQTEYFVPRRHAVAALRAMRELRGLIAPHLFISEVRSVAADELWMSPCYREACVGIHFTWLPEWEAVRELLPRIERALEPLGVRPHWGKLFTMAPEAVRRGYPRTADFAALAREFDPDGKLRNELLERYVFGG